MSPKNVREKIILKLQQNTSNERSFFIRNTAKEMNNVTKTTHIKKRTRYRIKKPAQISRSVES